MDDCRCVKLIKEELKRWKEYAASEEGKEDDAEDETIGYMTQARIDTLNDLLYYIDKGI